VVLGASDSDPVRPLRLVPLRESEGVFIALALSDHAWSAGDTQSPLPAHPAQVRKGIPPAPGARSQPMGASNDSPGRLVQAQRRGPALSRAARCGEPAVRSGPRACVKHNASAEITGPTGGERRCGGRVTLRSARTCAANDQRGPHLRRFCVSSPPTHLRVLCPCRRGFSLLRGGVADLRGCDQSSSTGSRSGPPFRDRTGFCRQR